MDGSTIGLIVGSNVVVLVGIASVGMKLSSRIGKLEGRLENGDFLRCPFYKKDTKNNNKGG